MGTLRKLAAAWQLGGQKELGQGYPTPSQLAPWWYVPSGWVDTSGVGNGRGNSIVTISLNTLSRSFNEPPPAVLQLDDDTQRHTPQIDHPAADLMREPNPYMVGELLWAWTLAANYLDGDAYWIKVRSAGGRVVELWPMRGPDHHSAMGGTGHITPMDGSGQLATPEERQLHAMGRGPFVAYYEYRVGSSVHRLERRDVVHLRLGLDPDDPRRGLAPVRSVLREVVGDEEAGQFAAALLKNMGIPGVVLVPDEEDDQGPDADEAEAIADEWEDRFGGYNRGRPLVMSGGRMKVQVVSFTPEQMNFTSLRRVPEERISAAIGVPAILAGLGAGLDRATYSNAGELREFMTEQTLTALWRLYGAQLTQQLLPDFSSARTDRMGWDLREVRALQEDQDKLFTRWTTALTAGGVLVSDYRAALGLEPAPNGADEVYLRPVSVVETPFQATAEELNPPPGPVPPQLAAAAEEAEEEAEEEEAEVEGEEGAPAGGEEPEG